MTPAHTRPDERWPRSRSSTVVQIGVVVARAIEEDTDVMCRLGSQSPKCSASSTPATADRPTATAPVASSARWRSSATGVSTPTARTLRHSATASAGAPVAAMSGADSEMPAMATPSRARSSDSGPSPPPAAAPVAERGARPPGLAGRRRTATE